MALVLKEKLFPDRPNSLALKLTLNDPNNLNAMGEEMAAEFYEIVNHIRVDSQRPTCIVLCGAGRAFSAGGNLEMLEAKTRITPDENRSIMLKFYNSFLSILELNVPLIAAINGHAVGAGLCLASACDIRLCSDTSKMGFTFTRLGLHPGMGATYFLPRILGYSRALELLVTARMIEAPEALRLGLVSQVLPAASLFSAVEKIVDEIEGCGPEATTRLVESLRRGTQDLNSSLDREALCQAHSYSSAEFLEGIKAAREKRQAKWK